MTYILAQSNRAHAALTLVNELQSWFVARLKNFASKQGLSDSFDRVTWHRDQGQHGGGSRFESGGNLVFNRASVNVSQVHYDDQPERQLAAATALSSIIHPYHPLAPSLHLHISWTELKAGRGYWRIMADLNPALEVPGLGARFEAALAKAAPEQIVEAKARGDRYFYIPALQRHRGVSHFYLEAYSSGDDDADRILAKGIGKSAIETYFELLLEAWNTPAQVTDFERQLAYHTLYFFQVLTLDRGTSSGLLVHDQNDLGILGSLPAQIDRDLLASWLNSMPSPQEHLLQAMLSVLPAQKICAVNAAQKLALAAVVRAHYALYPQALSLQASGDVIPPTVSNHLPNPLSKS
ncbi:MAG: coproporphyrinogen III oxidase [Candidatus Melainabacteria bacterium HGW-Melainabacteria-1]|nr:MAG: coproporphyrinogen III oxidase [Candidatus Melainabacteria bacterium HGW-Melainabacteria-1]